MGHKVKNYSANHRDEIARAGKTGKKKAASVMACCVIGNVRLVRFKSVNGTLICDDDYDQL